MSTKKTEHTPNILYADDDAGQRRLVQILLNRIGWDHRMASDGLEAVEMAGRESFDLIVLDLRMPHLDGFQTVRRLREQGVTVPTIALTALDYPELASDCQAAGYNGWLVKPITPHGLEQIMETYLAAGSSR
jgi:CheY-like chemotaxis protein